MATNLNMREWFSSISENIELGEDFDINEIPEVQLPEGYNESFHNNYLTLTAAKNNSDVMKHFRGKYLSTADGRLKAAYLANGGKEEDFNELKSKEPDSMKMIDLIVSDLATQLKSSSKAPTENKDFDAYKIQTSKQIEDLMKENSGWEDRMNSAINEKNGEWISKLKSSMINAKLNSKAFNDSIDKKDAVYLTMRRVEDSPFELRLDDELKETVYNKETGMEAIVDGKNVTWDYVLDESSREYTVKNDQKPTPPREVVVPTVTANAGEGKYIVGHADYGKA